MVFMIVTFIIIIIVQRQRVLSSVRSSRDTRDLSVEQLKV